MTEFFIGFAILLGYFIIFVVCLVLLRWKFPIPRELFRKTLHFVLLFSLLVFVYAFETWWISALAAVIFALLLFPVLTLGERFKHYSKLLTERKKGEIKRSMMVVFAMFACIISLCWGLLNEKILVFACVYAWGFGDGAAALVGKRFGKHCLRGKMIEGCKSVEGTLAMFAVSFVTVLVILLIRGGLPWHGYVMISFLTAAVSAVVELYTLDGFDTITCPFAAAATLLPLLRLWGGIPAA